jgi:hypothetical protein
MIEPRNTPEKIWFLPKIVEADRYFRDTKYQSLLPKIRSSWNNGNLELTEELLSQLPDEHELLSQLMERLKGKSVVKTFKKIGKGDVSEVQQLKALSSLLTHVAIECEQGRKEYRKLIPHLIEKISSLGYGIVSV